MTHRTQPNALALPLLAVLALPGMAAAAVTLQTNANRDTYVSSGVNGATNLSNLNFGGAGAMMISGPTAAQNRTQEALFSFDTAAIKSAFDAQFGVGSWVITALDLSLSSNFHVLGSQPGNTTFNKIAAGDFVLEWLSNDGWIEGGTPGGGGGGGNGTTVPPDGSSGVSWNSLPSFLATTSRTSVGTFTWNGLPAPENTNVRASWSLALASDVVSDIRNGGTVSFLGSPAENSAVGYLFNTTTQGNPAILQVTAALVPEPETTALLGMGLIVLIGGVLRGRREALRMQASA